MSDLRLVFRESDLAGDAALLVLPTVLPQIQREVSTNYQKAFNLNKPRSKNARTAHL